MRTRPAITLLVAFALVAHLGAVRAQGALPTAKPEDVGFSAERLGRVTEMLRANAAKSEIPGAVLLIARHGKVAYFESVGFLDPQSRAAMTKDAIFRIYSMSKAITSVAAMMLFEEGRFTLDEPVAKYLPQFEKLKVAADNQPGAPFDPETMALVPVNRPVAIRSFPPHLRPDLWFLRRHAGEETLCPGEVVDR